MYNSAQTIALQKSTGNWLSVSKDEHVLDIVKTKTEDLRNCLRFHEYRYYVQNDPLISDFEYDTLYKLLERFEKENPRQLLPILPHSGWARV